MLETDRIAYKVENGVITNTTVVDPNAPVEEGFVKRPYYLGIGYQEKFGDFYEDWVTEPFVEMRRIELKDRVDSLKQAALISIEGLNLSIQETQNTYNQMVSSLPVPEPGQEVAPTAEQLALSSELETLFNRKSMLTRYITYLSSFMDLVQNPVYQKIKNAEEL